MSRPCPFCGDTRPQTIDPEDIGDGGPVVYHATCQCCAAQGPMATSPAAAAELWDRQWPVGRSAEWRQFYDSIT